MAKGMNGGAQMKAKPTTKASATVKKTVKKRTKTLASAKAVRDTSEPKRVKVPLAEVKMLAAIAEKKIKATKKLTAAEKIERLEDLADTLERAKRFGGLSKCGVWGINHSHVPVEPYDRSLLES
ncbi:MAG: hypothetical protein LBC59_03665 [Chitinispirillales bacterium]|jgi:PHP family Zn ribbon phosphoesterase|nr:hypothetical protein [Chitinispirillales bacterium]